MRDLKISLKSLNRPEILVRAARMALTGFHRDAALTRIFGYAPTIQSKGLIEDLLEREELINTQRKTGDVTYNIARHITVLTALINEANAYFTTSEPVT